MKPITVVCDNRPAAEGQLRGMESKGAKDCKMKQLPNGNWQVTCHPPEKKLSQIWLPSKK